MGGPRRWEAQPVSHTSHDFRRGSLSPFCHRFHPPLTWSRKCKEPQRLNDREAGHTTSGTGERERPTQLRHGGVDEDANNATTTGRG